VHAGIGGSQRRQQAPRLLVQRRVKVLVAPRLSAERHTRVVGRRHDFRLHVEKVYETIEIELLCRGIFHLLAAAEDETLEGEYLSAVHVQSLAEASEALFCHRHCQLLLFDDFGDLRRHDFHLSLLTCFDMVSLS
jgi:hypothetical protein